MQRIMLYDFFTPWSVEGTEIVFNEQPARIVSVNADGTADIAVEVAPGDIRVYEHVRHGGRIHVYYASMN